MKPLTMHLIGNVFDWAKSWMVDSTCCRLMFDLNFFTGINEYDFDRFLRDQKFWKQPGMSLLRNLPIAKKEVEP